MKLYTYWRSSAAYRVRIALNLKGLPHELIPVDLVAGDHKQDDYKSINPQALVPTLEVDGLSLAQSLAIIEYLDECYPQTPLLPKDPSSRAVVRGLAQIVACDIHPLNNLRVLKYLMGDLALDKTAKDAWYAHWVREGFIGFESQLRETAGQFCFGDTPTLADVCLVPQVFNARRFECDLSEFPKITEIEARCLSLDAFDAARPERQPDAS